MANVNYREEGHDGRAYLIVEYHGAMPVYIFKGYPKEGGFLCYPHRALVKGERRDRHFLPASEVRRI